MKFKSDIEVQAGLKDSSGSNGTSGQVLSSNGATVSWINSDIGVASDVQNQVKAGVAINKGQAVYVTSADGTNIIVGLASNTTEATSSKTLGLLNATVAINGFADVVQIGRLAGLDTSTAIVGDPVWLGTNGNLIYGLANKPYAPAHLVFIGVVTRVNSNNGEIFINVQNGFELNEIHDVDIKTDVPINGDVLGYNGTLWVNKTIAEWLGFTPVSGTGASSQVAFWNGTSSITGSSNFTFASDRLIINRTSDSRIFLQEGGVNIAQLQANSGNVNLSNNSTGTLSLSTNGAARLTTFANGNVLIQSGGTFTDAGFRLDVNGTARVQGALTTTADATINSVNIGRGGGAIASNTRVGSSALNANTTGGNNTSVGTSSLQSNTSGNNNSAFGHQSLISNTTGSDNVSVGQNSLNSNTTGSQNVGVGRQALFSNTTGIYNVAIGHQAGRHISGILENTITNNSIYIGYFSKALANNQTNQIVIGHDATGLGSNTTVLGNSSTTTTAIYGDLLLGGTTDNGVDKLQVTGTANITGQLKLGSTITNGAYTYTLPGATGTLALVGGAGVGTVTSVAALTLGTTGTDLSSTVANGTTTPVITLNVPTASATNRGVLSAADWTTFNSKQNALTNPVTGTGASGQVAYWNGTSSITGESNLFWDSTNDRLGIGTASPGTNLHVQGSGSYAGVRISNTGSTGGGFMALYQNNVQSAFIGVAGAWYGNTDSNLGIAADTGKNIQFFTDGTATPKAIITSGGNVGIGTSSPVNPLTVQSNGSAQGIAILNRSSDDFSNLLFYNYAGSSVLGGIGNSSGRIRIMSGGVGDSFERLSITSGGNVGIGTTNPSEKLTLTNGKLFLTEADPTIGGKIYGYNDTSTDLYGGGLKFQSRYYDGANYIYVDRLTIKGNGNIGIGTTSPSNLLSVGVANSTTGKGITIENTSGSVYGRFGVINPTVDNDTYIGSMSNNNFLIYSNATERMRITSGGNVGIGTASPYVNTVLTLRENSTLTNALSMLNRNGTKQWDFSVDINSVDDGGLAIIDRNNSVVRLGITSGGNVGIGTTSPSGKLDVLQSNGNGLTSDFSAIHVRQSNTSVSEDVAARMTFNADGGTTVYGFIEQRRNSYDSLALGTRNSTGGAGYISLVTQGTEKVRVFGNGNVFIGSSPTDAGYKLDVAGNGRFTTSVTVNSSTTPFLYFHSTRTSGQSGYIKDDGNMVFQKTEAGGGFRFLNSSSSVLLSIDSGGSSTFSNNVTITPPSNQVGLIVNHSGTNGVTGSKFNAAGSGNTYGAVTATFDACNYGTGIKIVTGLYSTSLGAMQFFNSSTAVGTITCTTTSTAYNTSSDYRLKENVVPIQYAIDRLNALNPCRFNFINEPTKIVDGFIAHEVQEVIPEAVTGEKDELDYDGSPKYQGIDQSKLVPLLTAALQEAIEKINNLEQRINNLENKQ